MAEDPNKYKHPVLAEYVNQLVKLQQLQQLVAQAQAQVAINLKLHQIVQILT